MNENIALCEYQTNRQSGKEVLIKKLGKGWVLVWFADELSEEIKFRKENTGQKKSKESEQNVRG